MPRSLQILIMLLVLIPLRNLAQSDGHYTMFMFNKLYYNPAYAGEKEIISANATYRDQWADMPGAPKAFNFSVDGPMGKYAHKFRPVALGLIVAREQIGIENNTTIMGNYAYRFVVKNALLSLGLRGGTKLYSARYDQLDIAHQNDPNFQGNVSNLILPNFGAGAFWSAKDKKQKDSYFLGLSIPMLLQNRYGKNDQNNSVLAKETRCIYLTGGYVLHTGNNSPFTVTPQVLIRFIGNANYRLPVNCDMNLSVTYKDRIMFGITYRTDKSMEFITHLQILPELNIGYAYDNSTSVLSAYMGQTHEIVVGFDAVRKKSKYINPRFVRSF
jgi:type IX secretion system PorP/SprF family membrane protein